MQRLPSLRFAPLLVAMLFAMVASPPLAEAGHVGLSAAIALPAVLLAAMVAVARAGRWGRIAIGIWLGTLVLEALVHVPFGPKLPVVSRLLDAAFLAIVFVLILREVLRAQHVTLDVLLGSLCGYLLIGFFFVVVYSVLELARPGSFEDAGRPLGQLASETLHLGRFPALLYYSFVTLTTVGYGDVVAVGALARSLAALEAVMGQLYLTVLVAALVGMHLAQRSMLGSDAPRGPR